MFIYLCKYNIFVYTTYIIYLYVMHFLILTHTNAHLSMNMCVAAGKLASTKFEDEGDIITMKGDRKALDEEQSQTMA